MFTVYNIIIVKREGAKVIKLGGFFYRNEIMQLAVY